MTVTISKPAFRRNLINPDWVNVLDGPNNGFITAGIDSDDNVYYCGSTTAPSTHIFAKIAADGSLGYSKAITPSFGSWIFRECDSKNGYTAAVYSYVTGTTGLIYYYIVLTDSTGNVLFSKFNTFTYSGQSSSMRVAVDSSGNVYIFCSLYNSGAGGIAKIDNTGSVQWQKGGVTAGGNYFTQTMTIKLDSNNNPVLMYSANDYTLFVVTIDSSTGALHSPSYQFSIAIGSTLRFLTLDFSLSSSIVDNGYLLFWGSYYDPSGAGSTYQYISMVKLNAGTATFNFFYYDYAWPSGSISAFPVDATSGKFLLFYGPRYLPTVTFVGSDAFNSIGIINNTCNIETKYNRRLSFDPISQSDIYNIGCCSITSAGNPKIFYSKNGGIIVSYNIRSRASTSPYIATMRLNDNKYSTSSNSPPVFEFRQSNVSINSRTFSMIYSISDRSPASGKDIGPGTTLSASFNTLSFSTTNISENFISDTVTVASYAINSSTLTYKYY